MTKKLNTSFKFRSPINKEYSYTPVMKRLSDDTESEITVRINFDGTGNFEWDIPELEMTEHGGLWFEDNTLVDYDGVFELPGQLVNFLQEHGYNMDHCK